jgi:hypothetical protein
VHFLEWQGSLQDEASLVEALKQVDVVICAVSSNQVLDQKLLIPAIKQAGCIKVFISSFLLGFFFFFKLPKWLYLHLQYLNSEVGSEYEPGLQT